MKIKPNEIFSIQSEQTFNDYCIKIFQYQYKHNKVYQTFTDYILKNNSGKIPQLKHYTQIPFLPIEFFKTHTITCFPVTANTLYFQSSGTTQHNLSRHYVFDEKIYQLSVLNGFKKFYGDPENYLFIFLLPTEKERPHSSLIYMARYLQSLSKHPDSGFYLNNFELALKVINKNLSPDTKIFILGLSYALIDFVELPVPVNENIIIMDTGGMKGKREEVSKKYFYIYLKNKLDKSKNLINTNLKNKLDLSKKFDNINLKNNLDEYKIHSEYGMTELFSQAYSYNNGIFNTPPWMKVLVRELDDPLSVYSANKQGAINIIDLANIHTCSFIATSDIGKIHSDGSFELLGRIDFSDIRGCNLMYQ